MTTIEFVGTGTTLEIEYDAPLDLIEDPGLVFFANQLSLLRKLVNLVSFDLSRAPDNGGFLYTYYFVNDEGHEWTQNFRRLEGRLLSHGVFDEFDLLKMFDQHRRVFQLAVDLVAHYDVVKIVAVWT